MKRILIALAVMALCIGCNEEEKAAMKKVKEWDQKAKALEVIFECKPGEPVPAYPISQPEEKERTLNIILKVKE